MIDRALARSAAVLALAGAVLGVAVALLIHHVQVRALGGDVQYHGAYVPMQGITMSKAYASTLNVSVDPAGPGLWPLLGICVGAGVGAGVAVVLGLRLAGRRIALVSAVSPSGSAPR